MKILFLDTETTGLSETNNKVIEVSGAMMDSEIVGPNASLDRIDVRLNYHNDLTGPISLGALAVNGAAIERVTEASEGTVESSVGLVKFANWLVEMKRKHKDFAVCGHNVHFDIKFLKAALESVNLFDLEQVIGHRYLDTAAVALLLKDIGLLQVPKVNMEDLAKAMSLTAPPHTASGDTDQTIALYFKLRYTVESNLKAEVQETIAKQKAKEREEAKARKP